MPELPEVECIKRSLSSLIQEQKLQAFLTGRPGLRFPFPELHHFQPLIGQKLIAVRRRSKYLLLDFDTHVSPVTLVIHFGMSGHFQATESASYQEKRIWHPQEKHHHFSLVFDQTSLHYVDPRRFGFLTILPDKAAEQNYFQRLGPEPLGPKASRTTLADYLFQKSRTKKQPVKNFIMDSKNLVGVGNIYASESLFKAKIAPDRPANTLSKQHYDTLTRQIQNILRHSIRNGGTTLQDFCDPHGQKGRHQKSLFVYGRQGDACKICRNPIEKVVQAGRSSFFCKSCQKS